MNTEDLTIYAFTKWASATLVFPMAFIGALGLAIATALLLSSVRHRKPAVAVTAVVTLVLMGASVLIATATMQDDREADAEALTSNAQTLKAWAEPEYSITITDEAALSVMGAWADIRAGLVDPYSEPELVFEAETKDGPVEVKLKEEDGSFTLIQVGSELPKAADRS